MANRRNKSERRHKRKSANSRMKAYYEGKTRTHLNAFGMVMPNPYFLATR